MAYGYVIAGAAVVIAAAGYYYYASSQSGGNTGKKPEYDGIDVQTSGYGYSIPVVFGTMRISGNMIWAGDFKAKKHKEESGGKGGGGSTTTSYTYNISFAMGICEGQISGIGRMWIDKAIYGSVISGGSVFAGSDSQTPWSYLTANHPSEDLYYPDLAYFAIADYNMGSSNYLPNFNFEIYGRNILSGLNDANPADITTEIVSNTKFGLGLDESVLDVTDYYNYCMAANLLLSPAYASQSPAYECIQGLCAATNSEVILHDGAILKIVPYGDVEITANGVTWTPDLSAKYDLDDDDFLYDENDDPIKISRKTPADTFNKVTVEYKNRANNYNTDTVEVQDQGYIDLYGLRPDSTATMHGIAQKSIAQTVATLLLQRNLYVRNAYEFQLGWKCCLLEPMDIVTLTDAVLGLNKYPVRIKSIEENENGDLAVTAEDMPVGMATATIYESEDADGYAVDFNVDPGDVDTPVIFDAPGILTDSGYEIWCALSGGENWGGCDIYVSTDGVNYKYAGRQLGSARHGELTGTFAAGGDPDTTNSCPVDLSICEGTLLSGTQDDADNKLTLCKVGSELISYKTATLTATYKYTLGEYLRRGCYNTATASHASGSGFVRLDDQIFKYAYDPAYVGKTIYIKFASFNIYQSALQDLADVDAYTYTIGGSMSYPSNVTGFSAAQPGSQVIFSWNALGDVNLAAYAIRYAAQETATDEIGSVPATSPYTITVANASVFVADLGVKYQSSGTPLTKVTTPSQAGEYSVDEDTGVYTFYSADAGLGMLISYRYEAAEAWSAMTALVQAAAGQNTISATVASGNWTFAICGKDTSGNYSQVPTKVNLTVT